jgi:uncharacterized membrane protein YwzB
MLLIPILLILGGALAASSLIVQKQPNAREVISKLLPFQGIIGIILLIWGVIALLFWVLPAIRWGVFTWAPLSGLILLLSVLTTIALGLLLGYGLIAKNLLSNSSEVARSGEAMHMKLVRIQVPLGLLGIVLGLWALISFIVSPFTFM